MKTTARLVLLLLLAYILLGTLYEPYWWYRFIFEQEFRSLSFWVSGIAAVLWNLSYPILFAILIVWVLLVSPRTSFPDRLLDKSRAFWMHCVVGNKFRYSALVLLLGVVIGVATVDTRSSEQRKREREWQETMRNFKVTQASLASELKPKDKPPLSEPTTFVYLDKAVVESLYGQYEPELVLALAIEEFQESQEFRGKVSFEQFLSTEVGKEQYDTRLEQYRRAPKNTERKLKDLLAYMSEKKALRRFGDVKLRSQELKDLDAATKLLSGKYDLVVNKTKLRLLRDRLLVQEMQSLEEELRGLRGLVLVEGDWTINIASDEFVLERPFLENVTNPPICQVRLPRSQVAARDQAIIEDLTGKRMRVSVFGNVLVGMSDESKRILLSPVAVF